MENIQCRVNQQFICTVLKYYFPFLVLPFGLRSLISRTILSNYIVLLKTIICSQIKKDLTILPSKANVQMASG